MRWRNESIEMRREKEKVRMGIEKEKKEQGWGRKRKNRDGEEMQCEEKKTWKENNRKRKGSEAQ